MHGPGIAGLLLSAALAVPALAQTVDLRVREEADSTPVVGAIVRLTGSGAAARGLTNEIGRVVLRGPGPGSYRIRIDRIGFSGFTTDPFTLDSGQTLRLAVPMPSRRVQLPTLEARGRSRCDPKTQGGPLASALWEEIQKALTANVITQADSVLPLHLRRFVRELDRQQRPQRSWVDVSRIVRGAPFGSLAPGFLMEHGFVRDVDGEMAFAGPDAALMLSDEFVSTHCFRAVPGPSDLVGLAFQPVPGRRVPEVEGALWVDRGTSELRFLEYTYTGLPRVLRSARLGGRVEFSRLPAGGWIVSYWHIRMPRVRADTVLVEPRAREVVDLAGYRDRGGRAEVAGDTSGLIHRAIVRGRVYDSLAQRGLEGALVWVNGTTDTMPTDSDGRFYLVVDASGDQLLSVRHPRLGLLGEPTRREVLLSLGDTTVVEFGVPAMETFLASFCRHAIPPGTAGIVGVATRADGAPAPEWEVRVMRRAASGRNPVASNAATGNRTNNINYTIGVRPVRPRRNGLFGVCGVPAGDTVQLIGAIGRLTQVEQTVPLPEGSRWVDLREWGSVDTTHVAPSMIEVTDPNEAALEPSVVVGRVYDSTTATGIAGAIVRIQGTRDSAVTDEAGAFTLRSGVSGARNLTVMHPTLGTLLGELNREEVLLIGDTTIVAFPLIPLDALVGRLCGGGPGGRSGFLGIARDATGRPAENIGILLTWLTPDGWHEERRSSTAGGLYFFCDLVSGQDLHVRMQAGDGRAGWTIKLERGQYHWADLHVTTEP